MSYILILFFGFFTSLVLTYSTIKWARKKQIFESTDERKNHTEKVSALGGIGLFISFWTMVFLLDVSMEVSLPIFFATSLLFGIGMIDDLMDAGILSRLFLQSLAGFIACYAGFHFTISTGEWSLLINYGSSILFVMLLINSVNFIDGINGLVGGLGIITMTVFGGLFYLIGMFDLVLISAVLIVALFGFLMFNYGEQAAIFMGDNGSTVLGFLMSILAMKASQFVAINEVVSNWILIGVVLSIPVIDLFAVVFLRMSRGSSPLIADRIHIHHLITDSGLTHPASCHVIWSWSILLIIVGCLPIELPVFAIVLCSYLLVRTKYTYATAVVLPVDLKEEKQKLPPPLSA